jgi:hypothetical protein
MIHFCLVRPDFFYTLFSALGGWEKIKFYFLTICSLNSKMGKLKYLSGGQNKNKNLFWNKILF